MVISYTHQFIFFHVAKVAGISIREALKEYTQEPEKFKIKRPPRQINGRANPLYTMWESALTHVTAQEARKELGETFHTCYTFAFVRNPWDWQVSMYHFLLKETDNPRYEEVRAMSGFEEYLEWVIATRNPYPRGATKLQSEMITDADGDIIVDFVGRFEHLAADFAQVCQRLNIAASLPHLNSSQHRDYRSYYNERTRRLVEDYCAADIELFGYTFEGVAAGVSL
jgi:hypothetical protein